MSSAKKNQNNKEEESESDESVEQESNDESSSDENESGSQVESSTGKITDGTVEEKLTLEGCRKIFDTVSTTSRIGDFKVLVRALRDYVSQHGTIYESVSAINMPSDKHGHWFMVRSDRESLVTMEPSAARTSQSYEHCITPSYKRVSHTHWKRFYTSVKGMPSRPLMFYTYYPLGEHGMSKRIITVPGSGVWLICYRMSKSKKKTSESSNKSSKGSKIGAIQKSRKRVREDVYDHGQGDDETSEDEPQFPEVRKHANSTTAYTDDDDDDHFGFSTVDDEDNSGFGRQPPKRQRCEKYYRIIFKGYPMFIQGPHLDFFDTLSKI